jgi:hypothetical protein
MHELKVVLESIEERDELAVKLNNVLDSFYYRALSSSELDKLIENLV